jgi:hypothetical protein
MKRGDLIKIVFEDDCNPVMGMIVDITNKYENQTFIIIKLLLISAEVQEIWVTHDDQIEMIHEYV